MGYNKIFSTFATNILENKDGIFAFLNQLWFPSIHPPTINLANLGHFYLYMIGQVKVAKQLFHTNIFFLADAVEQLDDLLRHVVAGSSFAA